MHITAKNYRCFDSESPLDIDLNGGIVSYVGPNNAGKTATLRFLFEFRDLWKKASTMELRNLIKDKSEKSPPAGLNISYNGVKDPNSIFRKGQAEIIINFSIHRSDIICPKHELYVADVTLMAAKERPNDWYGEFFDNNGNRIERLKDKLIVKGEEDKHDLVDCSAINEAFGLLKDVFFIGAIRSPVATFGGKLYDIEFGKSFANKWNALKTGYSETGRENASRVRKDIERIFELGRLDISASQDMENLCVEIDDDSRLLTEMGEGIGQFIITFASVAIQQPSFILIDEPEHSLHATLQLDFISTLATYARHGLHFTTHSIGLARSASHKVMSVYRDKIRNATRTKAFIEASNFVEILGELNYSAYRDTGWNKILLVEGVSDVKVFQHFLRLFGLEHKVAIVQAGGDSLVRKGVQVELEELKRVSNDNLFVVVDSEKTDEGAQPHKNRKGFKAICDELNIPCLLTEKRSTENYFTDRAVKKVMGAQKSALSQFQKPDQWDKKKNWEIALQMTRAEIESTDIGQFIIKKLA